MYCLWLQVQTAVRALLTPFMYMRVQKPEDHVELLTILTTERSNPLVVWSPAMRKQLRAMIDEHERSVPVTHDALRTLGAFKYDQVSEELVIEDVYVRLFCEVWELALFSILGAAKKLLRNSECWESTQHAFPIK